MWGPVGGSGKRRVPAISPPTTPTSVPAAAPPAPSVAKDYVEGMIESVSGTAVGLRTRTGSAAVDFTPATRVVDVAPAKLSDITPGSCVNVRATPQSGPPAGGAITAQTVTITPGVDGRCPPPAGFYGTVAAVSGNTITVMGVGGQPATTNVNVVDATSYTMQTATDTRAIQNGKCMGAQGDTIDGVLHAAMISLQACPPMGHHHHHLHLPHFHL
ncbi:DUF5666 domain-containing protein [Mycobacterium parmense]|uniref:DUF5666 domain-containing protein n=1 Tax=Mycobacterium parmense TaxID=185642 RepID=A0A7I7YSA6_9MYCO|nr:DUF5666 domain-containing protein [Mycobacterium parmense]BBZ44610.1 hypothetical protein MPRM_18910 [Mycobacterium parmense]